jgi:hypothetical protein
MNRFCVLGTAVEEGLNRSYIMYLVVRLGGVKVNMLENKVLRRTMSEDKVCLTSLSNLDNSLNPSI